MQRAVGHPFGDRDELSRAVHKLHVRGPGAADHLVHRHKAHVVSATVNREPGLPSPTIKYGASAMG